MEAKSLDIRAVEEALICLESAIKKASDDRDLADLVQDKIAELDRKLEKTWKQRNLGKDSKLARLNWFSKQRDAWRWILEQLKLIEDESEWKKSS